LLDISNGKCNEPLYVEVVPVGSVGKKLRLRIGLYSKKDLVKIKWTIVTRGGEGGDISSRDGAVEGKQVRVIQGCSEVKEK
jgi:hypothetical protein